MIKISIIVPVYNVEKYISRCLNSLINQTLDDIEIICVNDCSVDNSFQIVKEYAARDSRFVLIEHETNQGLGSARNSGIGIASGEYIIFIDSDDYIDTDYCEKLYNTAKKYDADIVVTNLLKHKKRYNRYNVFFKSIKEAIDLSDKINICKDNKQRFFNATNKIFRNDFLKYNKILFQVGCYFEDVMFTVKSIFLANKIVSCPEVAYHYMENPSSIVKSKNSVEKKKRDHFDVYTELQKYANDKKICLPERLNYIDSYYKTPFIKVYRGIFVTKYTLFGIVPLFKIRNKK